MTREPDRPADSPATLDDDQLAALVRAGAEDWRLPPQRLDQPTWRDRVGAPARAGAGAGSPGWPRRRRGRCPGHGPRRVRRRVADLAALEHSDRCGIADARPAGRRLRARPRRGTVPVARSLRRHRVCPSCRSMAPCPILRVMVRSDATYRLVDLSTGKLGPASVGTYAGPADDAAPSVRWLGLHLHGLDAPSSGGSGLVVTFEPVDRRWNAGTPVTLRTVRGESDPSLSDVRPAAARRRRGQRLAGRALCLRWLERPAWRERLDGRHRRRRPRQRRGRRARIPLAVAQPAGAANRTRHPGRAQGQPLAIGRRGPRVELLVRRQPIRHAAVGHGSLDRLVLGRCKLGALSAAGSTAGETCGEADSGPIDATTYYVLCVTPARSARGRARIGPTGRGSTRPPSRARARASSNRRSSLRQGRPPVHLGSGRGSTRAVRPAHRHDGQRRRHRPGAVRGRGRPSMRSRVSAASSGAGWLRQWRPRSSSSRPSSRRPMAAASTGSGSKRRSVRAVARRAASTSSMRARSSRSATGHRPPTSVSLAISPDGQFVYAAGQAGVDAAGASAPYRRRSPSTRRPTARSG